MDMNSKGFTLIEILIVITILAVVGVVITVNLAGTFESTNQKKCDEFVRKIEDAACAYSSLHKKNITCNRAKCNPIPLSTLISEGFIDDDEKDACTTNDIDSTKTVTITWNSDGEKICTYNGVKTYGQ